MATILVVDDDPANRLLASTVLTHAGHTVLEAATAAAALELIVRSPDAVLVDLSLPDLSGAELIGRIRRGGARVVPIVLYTATTVDGAMRDFMEMHAIAYVIEKPSDPSRMLATVEAALGKNL